MLGAATVHRQSSGNTKLVCIGTGQIGAEGFPTVSFVLGAENVIPAGVNRSGVMR